MDTTSLKNNLTEELRLRIRRNKSFVAKTYKDPWFDAPTNPLLGSTFIGWLWVMLFLILYTDVFISPPSFGLLYHYCGIFLFTGMHVRAWVGYLRKRKTIRS